MEYTIGEVAKIKHLSVSTLRYYDERGLLPYLKRTKTGERIFSNVDLEWVGMIAHLKRSGMTLTEIKQFVDFFMNGNETLENRRQMFYTLRETIRKRIISLNETMDILDYKCWFYDTAVEHGTIDVPRQMPKEKLPEEIRNLKELLIERHEADGFYL